MPPIMWDGVDTYPGGHETLRMWFKDGPVANLRMTKGGAVETANPVVTPSVGAPGLVEPSPVVLPIEQDKLAS